MSSIKLCLYNLKSDFPVVKKFTSLEKIDFHFGKNNTHLILRKRSRELLHFSPMLLDDDEVYDPKNNEEIGRKVCIKVY
jgi:hypothetical protein